MVKIQRTKTIEGNHYVTGPAVYIKLTNKQLKKLISSEESIKDGLASGDEGCPLYPIRQMYLIDKFSGK